MSLLRAVTQVGPELGPPLQQQLVPLQQLQKWLSSQTFFFFFNIHCEYPFVDGCFTCVLEDEHETIKTLKTSAGQIP